VIAPSKPTSRLRIFALAPLLALACLLSGCFGRPVHATVAPTSTGHHRVGVTSIVVRDAARDRKLDVEIWYPAGDASPAQEAAVYEVKALGSAVARLRSPTGARRDARPSKAGGPRPVILLSHGAGSCRFANASLAEVLASHGYLVVAPDHAGTTTRDKVWGITHKERAQSVLDRPLDLSRVLDVLEERSAGDDPLLGGLVDPGRIAVVGHSFGGATALALVGARFALPNRAECRRGKTRRCRALPIFQRVAQDNHYRYRDPRVGAAVLITPSGFEFYGADGVAQVDAPVLVVGARRDRVTPFAERHQPLVQALEGRGYLLELPDAGHLTATDACSIIESTGPLGKAFGGDHARDGCGEGYMPTPQALELVSTAALAFFDVHLNHAAGASDRLEAALAAPTRAAALTASTDSVRRF
jgi:predicted dienelactone hydrolase